jgi:hypothetical protein
LLDGPIVTMVAEPDMPSLVAVIATVPGLTAVTRPVELTVATCELAVVQATARPDNTLPPASFVGAVS